MFWWLILGGSLWGQTHMTWSAWSVLPDNPELAKSGVSDKQPGLAGVYAGVSNGMLIVAGGANFPFQPPWEGGEKVYWDHIYVCPIQSEDGEDWMETDIRLPVPMGYGGVVEKDGEIILIGGENSSGPVDEVVALSWDPDNQEIVLRSLSVLPEGFHALSAGKVGGRILVHGVDNSGNALWEWNPSGSWISRQGCPGPPRWFPATAVQHDGYTEGFYLFSGRSEEQGKISLLSDGYMYDHVRDEWTNLGVLDEPWGPKTLMGAAAVPIGSAHIFVFGGDDGLELLERVRLNERISMTSEQSVLDSLRSELTSRFTQHPGFMREVRSYHTITNTWHIMDTFPSGWPVTTSAFNYNNHVFIVSGEIHPGIRTPTIWKGSRTPKTTSFGTLNYVVIGIYFLLMILIGVKFSRRQKTTTDYFKGGGRIPWWAAGLSLFGTSLSAITFMAIPAKTYMTDWGYFLFQMTPLVAAPVLIGLYIPYFRSLNITSAYEYLENRFNLLTRMLGSLSFMILQLGRVGIVLFLPSLAVNLVTGIDITTCIIVMGVVSILYTIMGGIEAVIWTDVLQVIILMGGAFLALFWMINQIEIGGFQAFNQLAEDHKFQILDSALDFRKPTIWVVLLGGFFANLITSGSDQTMVQRYLTTSSRGEANRSVWTFALLAIPATLIFFSIGSTLYLFYQHFPDRLDVGLTNHDAIFPWYIVSELPQGVSGLLIAGIFSAAMSTLSSSMNSVSTAFITDFYQRFSWGKASDELRMAKTATLVFGVIGTGFALLMGTMSIQSLWDQFQLYVGLFAGGLGGLFLLGMTAPRAHGRGAVVGLVLSGIIQYFLTQYTHLHVLMFSATGFLSCYVLSYLFSILIPPSREQT